MTSAVDVQRVAVAGATGRMGRMLLEGVRADDGFALAGALDRAGSPALGQDAGAPAGWHSGVPITSDVAAGITAVYADVNKNLIAHHVLPRINFHVKRARDVGVAAVPMKPSTRTGTCALAAVARHILRFDGHYFNPRELRAHCLDNQCHACSWS